MAHDSYTATADGPDNDRQRHESHLGSETTLRHRVVEYPTGADRCTVYSEDTSGVERMSTWLSVDVNCLLDLEERR